MVRVILFLLVVVVVVTKENKVNPRFCLQLLLGFDKKSKWKQWPASLPSATTQAAWTNVSKDKVSLYIMIPSLSLILGQTKPRFSPEYLDFVLELLHCFEWFCVENRSMHQAFRQRNKVDGNVSELDQLALLFIISFYPINK